MEHLEEMLHMIFTNFSQLNFDKGQELIDKLKDTTQPGAYKLLLNQLPNLIVAERSYVNLGFVTTKNKIFLRKDNSIRAMLEGLRAELARLEESCGLEKTAVLTAQICLYVTARIQLIDVYEKMYAMGMSNKMMKYEELLTLVEGVVDSFTLTHEALTPMKTAISLECEILMLLLKAQMDIQNWRFLSTLLHLHGANTRIAAWEKILQSKESWKLGFGASFLKVNALPPLVQWLVKLKQATVNKFSLYFHHTLMQQTSPLEFRALTSKHNIDTFQRLQNVQRRYDAMTVMLLFDTAGATDYGPSYKQPPTKPQDPKPTEPYLIMVYCPIKLLEQMPTISKAISERSADLATLDRVVCCYSTKDQSSYFMTSLDPRVTMVFVFDSKKDEKETSLCKYILELSVQLRTSNQIFSKLKLNNK